MVKSAKRGTTASAICTRLGPPKSKLTVRVHNTGDSAGCNTVLLPAGFTIARQPWPRHFQHISVQSKSWLGMCDSAFKRSPPQLLAAPLCRRCPPLGPPLGFALASSPLLLAKFIHIRRWSAAIAILVLLRCGRLASYTIVCHFRQTTFRCRFALAPPERCFCGQGLAAVVCAVVCSGEFCLGLAGHS